MKNKRPQDDPAYKNATDEGKIRYYMNSMKKHLQGANTDAAYEELVQQTIDLYNAGKDAAELEGATIEDFIAFINGEIARACLNSIADQIPASTLTDLQKLCGVTPEPTVKVNTTLPPHSNN